MPDVIIQKLTATDGFIAFDLDDAPAFGVTRSAPKILVDGAQLLARTLTYRFASFERQIGGASAGINAAPDARADAVVAFCGEVEPLTAGGRFLTEPARGVSAADLGPLRAVDPRPAAYWDRATELTGASVAAAAAVAVGGLAGKAVAIEGFDATGAAVAAAVVEQGATVIAISTADGTAFHPVGFDPTTLAEAWAEHGPKLIGALSTDPVKTDVVFGAEVDVLVAGSKPGIIDHLVAVGVRARAVVPAAAVPVTAKGLATLRRAGTVVVPDFVSTAGPLFAGWPIDAEADPRPVAVDAVTAVLTEIAGHADGMLLGACHRAEAFLSTWRAELPFGRPLA